MIALIGGQNRCAKVNDRKSFVAAISRRAAAAAAPYARARAEIYPRTTRRTDGRTDGAEKRGRGGVGGGDQDDGDEDDSEGEEEEG